MSSRRRLLMPWKFNKKFTETKSEKSSENSRGEAVPTMTKYITASGKQVLTLLQSAAAVIPVPMLQEAFGVAIKIIEVCEDISSVEQKVKELQDRVCHLMVVIVDNVTANLKNEGGDEVIVKTAKGIERDIKDLLSTLRTIHGDLAKITAQDRWRNVFYKDLNSSAIDTCLNQLSTALEKFKFANDLRDSDLLLELYGRLAKFVSLTRQVHEDVKDIKQILAKTQQSATRPTDVVRQQMPLKPEVFHGRDGIVQDITQLLTKEETSRICILGPGGMGKTSISLAVVEQALVEARFPPENRVWVPCIEATSATLLLEILYIQLQISGDEQVTLEKIISKLNTSKEPRLILLDNFETPCNAPGGTQKEVEDILRRLARLTHVAILITMRGRFPPCGKAINWQSKHIQPTDEIACLRIYHDIHPKSENDPDVSKLFPLLGHMPFAVTLMANLAKHGQSSAEELLVAWSKFGPDILPNHHEQSMNRSISLSVDSYPMRQNPQAFLLLKILSLLPAGTTKANLRWWLPVLDVSMIPSAIATLSHAALLVENKQQDSDSPVLSVLPVVQLFMQQHDRIEEEIRNNIQTSCCQYVLDHACRSDDPTFPAKTRMLAAEDINIQAILCGSPAMRHSIMFSDKTIEALIAFSWHRCHTKPNLEIANHAVIAAKASAIEKYIASAVWCLGRTYFLLSEFHLAYNHLQEAYEVFNALPPGDRELQRLCCECGNHMIVGARMVLDTDKAVSLARDVETKSAALLDDVVYAQSLISLGATLNQAGQREEALHHLDRAMTMSKAVGSIRTLASACQITARVHYYDNRLSEALDVAKEAWKYAKLSNSLSVQTFVSREVSTILFSANKDTEAWSYIETALMNYSHLGNRRGSAISLEYMGYGYLRRGDYLNAYDAYEAAAEKYLGIPQHASSETRCKKNMAEIKRKQMNPGLNVGYERPYLDNDKSLFYPAVKTLAGDRSWFYPPFVSSSLILSILLYLLFVI